MAVTLKLKHDTYTVYHREETVCVGFFVFLSLSLTLTNTPKWTHFTCQTSTLNAMQWGSITT